MSQLPVNRRVFLQASSAGALTLTIPWASRGLADGPVAANAFVTLFSDGTAELTIPRSEMGQGILTTLSMVIAEELEIPWDHVSARQATADAGLYGAQGTGGSASVRTRYNDLRKAGAAVREMLRSAAASAWQLPLKECRAIQGMIVHLPSGRRSDYASLLPGIANMPVPTDPPLKPSSEFRLIGRSQPPMDLNAILTGKVSYGIDQRQPGMVFAAVARCPIFGGSLVSVNDSAAKAIEGFIQTIQIPAIAGNAGVAPGVAVVADSSWAAFKARDALQIDWRPPAGELESDGGNLARMRALLDAPAEDELLKIGTPEDSLAAAGKTLSADYSLPLLAHASLEPQNCTARFHDGLLELWSPSQTPNFARMLAAQATGLPQEQLRLHVTRIGGSFGRRLNVDFAVEAALVAKALDGPAVQLVWSRADDLQHDFYRPCALHRLTASQDADGMPEAWDHHFSTPAIFAGYQLPPNSDRPGLYEATGAVRPAVSHFPSTLRILATALATAAGLVACRLDHAYRVRGGKFY